MDSVYQLRANELDERFLYAIKSLFKDKNIILTISTIDETEYLLHSKTNRDRLLKSLDNIKKGKNIVEFNSIEDLKKAVKKNAKNIIIR